MRIGGDAADSSQVSIVANAGDDIDNHTTPSKAGIVKINYIQGTLTGNTFECLTICDDASNLEETFDRAVVSNVKSTLSGLGSLESSKIDLPNIADLFIQKKKILQISQTLLLFAKHLNT